MNDVSQIERTRVSRGSGHLVNECAWLGDLLAASGSENSTDDSSNKMLTLMQKISSFISLPSNWDGYGAIPALKEVGVVAGELLLAVDRSFVNRLSDIFPNPHGTITMEWENESKEKLSLEIGSNNYSYFVMYAERKPLLVDGTDILADLDSLARNLEEMFGKPLATGWVRQSMERPK